MNAGDPGPPFKYLYVHPTAKSTSNSVRSVSIAPADVNLRLPEIHLFCCFYDFFSIISVSVQNHFVKIRLQHFRRYY